MLYILWGLLNLFLFGIFIRTLYQAAVILYKELSRFSALVLLLGMISYACGSGKEEPEEKAVWDNEKAAKMDPLPPGSKELVVEDRLTYSRKIDYFTGEDSLGNKIIARAVWKENGLKAFTQNHLEHFSINDGIYSDTEHPENSLNGTYYRAIVREEWYLLGLKVATYTQQFKGIMH